MTNAGNLWNEVPQPIITKAIKESSDDTRKELAQNVKKNIE